MKKKSNAAGKIAGLIAAVLMGIAMTACSMGQSMLAAEENSETGGFDVSAENAEEASVTGSFTIGDGECLVLSPMVEKGHLVVTVVRAADFEAQMEEDPTEVSGEISDQDKVLEVTVDNKIMSAHPIEPGEYYAFVSAEKEKTTGTMTVLPRSIEELRKEDASLVEALGEAGADSGVPLPSEALEDQKPAEADTAAEAETETAEPADAADAGTAEPAAAETAEEASADEDGQNPVMNFVGPYQWDRCGMQIECADKSDAKITVHWASSASENTEWTMQGTLDTETLTVEYDNCVQKHTVYNENGEIELEEVVYENGTGRIHFNEDGTVTWEDDQEHIADGGVFEFAAGGDME